MPLHQGYKTTAGKTWQRLRWCLFLLFVLTSLAVTAVAVPQATQGQPGRPEDKRSVPSSSAALTAPPVQAKASPQTAVPDKSTGPQGEDVLKAAQMALSSSQQAVSLAQLCFNVLSIGVTVVTVVIAIVGLVVGFDVRRMRKDVPVLERTVTEALEKSQQLKASQDDVIKSSQDALREIKRNSESLELLNSLYGLNDANQKKALKFLQKLAQKRHQMGINPMVQILQDPAKGPALRAEAAYGLGRYAEVKE